jgi:hypothetical protein
MEPKNYGLKFDKYEVDQYFLGGGFLGTKEILPSGDWTPFVPVKEYQNKYGLETYACARFGTLNAYEILFSFCLREEKNFSDRFLSIVAGGSRNGDSPHNVAEAMRKIGAVDEEDLPFTEDINTLDKYYSPNPMTASLLKKGKEFLKQYEVGNEWVYAPGTKQTIDQQNAQITEALKRSPVGASVSAWHEDGQGGYDQAWTENHWGIFLKDLGTYWKVYDTYDDIIKKYSKKSHIQMAKVYTVKKLVVEDSTTLFNKFWQWILAMVNRKITETTVVQQTTNPIKKVDITVGLFCLAIQQFEGWIEPGKSDKNGKVYPNGSLSYRNCNPGNLKHRDGMLLAIGKDINGFAKFASYHDGFLALTNKIKNACTNQSTVYSPDDSILKFFQKYAPTSDGNYPETYAKFVATKLNVDTSFQIKNLVV